MSKTTKANEITSLSEMLDDISINELGEYLKKLKEFENTIDNLLEEKNLIKKDLEETKEIINEKVELMNKQGKILEEITENGTSKITKKSDNFLNILNKDFVKKLETFKQHEDNIENVSEKLKDDFEQTKINIENTIKEIQKKLDKKFNNLIGDIEEKDEKNAKEMNKLNSKIQNQSTKIKELEAVIEEEKETRQNKINIIWGVIAALLLAILILFLINLK